MSDGAAPHESGQAVRGFLAGGFARLVTGPARYLIVLGWIGVTIAAYRLLPCSSCWSSPSAPITRSSFLRGRVSG